MKKAFMFTGSKEQLAQFLATIESKMIEDQIEMTELFTDNLGLVWEASQELKN